MGQMMDEDSNTERKAWNVSKIARGIAFVIVAGMLVLAVIAQFTTPDTPETPEEAVEATVQAGIQERLTEVVIQTGTPNPTDVRETIDASVDATLTQIVAGSATPVPSASSAEGDSTEVPGILRRIWNFIVSVVKAFGGILVWLWNFAGKGGIILQVICCIVPALVLIIGVLNDPRRR
jgi:hypothetical protein